MDTVEHRCDPWNRGKLLGQKPPLKPKEIWAIRIRLLLGSKLRDLALFDLAIDSKLRGCDLVALRVHDVVQGSTGRLPCDRHAEEDPTPSPVRDYRADPGRGQRLDRREAD